MYVYIMCRDWNPTVTAAGNNRCGGVAAQTAIQEKKWP